MEILDIFAVADAATNAELGSLAKPKAPKPLTTEQSLERLNLAAQFEIGEMNKLGELAKPKTRARPIQSVGGNTATTVVGALVADLALGFTIEAFKPGDEIDAEQRWANAQSLAVANNRVRESDILSAFLLPLDLIAPEIPFPDPLPTPIKPRPLLGSDHGTGEGGVAISPVVTEQLSEEMEAVIEVSDNEEDDDDCGGNCKFPHNRDSLGRRCGARSALSRARGCEPLGVPLSIIL